MAGLLVRLGLVTGLIVALLGVIVWRTAASSPDAALETARRPLVSQPVILAEPVGDAVEAEAETVTLSAPVAQAAVAEPTASPPAVRAVVPTDPAIEGMGAAASPPMPAAVEPPPAAEAGPLEAMTVPLPQPDPRRLQAAADNGTAQP